MGAGLSDAALDGIVLINSAAGPRFEEGVAPPSQLDNCEYTVWYATNRRPNIGEPHGYSALRDDKVHHGFCNVYISKSHKIGSIGSLW
jgi:esterase/lipase superfamily enzyme